MDTDHNKIVQEIERKMAGAAMLKSEEEKKQEIFQYGKNQSEFESITDQEIKPEMKMKVLISSNQAEKALLEIFNFYLSSYAQYHLHYETFDQMNERKLTFQPYILFMKSFKLLKTIFHVDKLKLLFKKYSNFGHYLTYENFVFLINELSHQPESKTFFHIDELSTKPSINLETIEQIEKQEMYEYLGLGDPEKYRKNFKNVFRPFLCKQDVDTQQIKYTYRKFSDNELLKKSVPHKIKTEGKELYVAKNNNSNSNHVTNVPKPATGQLQQNVFNQAKSIVVSWQSFRSKSLASLQKKSQDLILRKYVKNDLSEDQYLREYNNKQKVDKNRLEKKIYEMEAEQQDKNKLILAKLEQKTTTKQLHLNKSTKQKNKRK